LISNNESISGVERKTGRGKVKKQVRRCREGGWAKMTGANNIRRADFLDRTGEVKRGAAPMRRRKKGSGDAHLGLYPVSNVGGVKYM